jgi:hypothetical protein
MANTTFSGPVISKNGFIGTGPGSTVALTANTSLTVNAHAGRILLTQDADGIFTLPSIVATADAAVAGPGSDLNNANNVGASFYFFVDTTATDVQIVTDGTDKFVGAAAIGSSGGTISSFFPAASNDVLSMNGTTTGGISGSVVQVTALQSAEYLVHNSLLLGSGTLATPFSDT